MARIIVDSYVKDGKNTFGGAENAEFNRRILAVNNMYGWLYDHGILGNVSFEFKDYAPVTYFALDTDDLKLYRSAMEASGVVDAGLAVHHIFDQDYTPCMYSGAIELGWTMSTYRDVDGCVGRSWECDMIKGLNTEGIYDVLKVQEEKGVKEAVSAMFGMYTWQPTLTGQKTSLDAAIQSAKEHTSSAKPALTKPER